VRFSKLYKKKVTLKNLEKYKWYRKILQTKVVKDLFIDFISLTLVAIPKSGQNIF